MSEYESFYEDYLRKMEYFYNRGTHHGEKYPDAKSLQDNWFYNNIDMQYDEYERLVTVLDIIKLEIEKNMLTEELLEELEIYYEDFNNGVFDNLIDKEEYDIIKKDLYWCYEHRNMSTQKDE